MDDKNDVLLSWQRHDFEQRIGFRGGRHTRVNTLLSFIAGCLLTIGFYVAIVLIGDSTLSRMFMERGAVPYFICLLSFWSFSILFIKTKKLRFQRRSLLHTVVPSDPAFVLSVATVDDVFDRVYEVVDDPKHFVLFNRISIALSNLRNLGRVSDVDEILRSQAEHDQASLETSFSLVHGFVWAIPVLGFIGTVLGLSQALGGFGDVLGSTTEVGELTSALRGVTSGLGTAFETTLEALVAALVIQLLVTFVQKWEEEFLDDCSEYCLRHIVGRLRIMPYQQPSE